MDRNWNRSGGGGGGEKMYKQPYSGGGGGGRNHNQPYSGGGGGGRNHNQTYSGGDGGGIYNQHYSGGGGGGGGNHSQHNSYRKKNDFSGPDFYSKNAKQTVQPLKKESLQVALFEDELMDVNFSWIKNT